MPKIENFLTGPKHDVLVPETWKVFESLTYTIKEYIFKNSLNEFDWFRR